jgi:formylglycine-generating enzyme required for sulfatase activity
VSPATNGDGTLPVGSFAATGGVFDLAGNIREWTADVGVLSSDSNYRTCWPNDRPLSNPFCGRDQVPMIGDNRSVRGGGYAFVPGFNESASRTKTQADHATQLIGIRCARIAH